MNEKSKRLRTISIMFLLTLTGKVLGLVRDMLMGRYFGTGPVADAFFVASQVPRNFFDAIFASAISASFIPVFNEYLEKEGREEAFRLASSFITLMALLTTALAAAGMVFAGPLASFQAGGFSEAALALCTGLLRTLFPTIIFTGLAFSMVGVLQSLGEFNVPALLSTVSNGIIILYYFTLCNRFGVWGLAAAYLLGWAMQAAVQVPSMHRLGYRYRPALTHPGLKKVFALMASVMVSTWIQPVNMVVSTRYASGLYPDSGVSAMTYANTLYTILAGVLVLSVSNVIFPELSRLAVSEQGEDFGALVSSSIRSLLFLLIPMTVGLMTIAEPLVRMLYDWGEWTAEGTRLTSEALMLLSLGMAGYGIQTILSRAFYAFQSGKAPLIAGIVSIAVNLVLCQLTRSAGIGGLALAASLAATVPAVLLLAAMGRTYKGLLTKKLLGDLLRMLAAALIMGGAVLAVRFGLQGVAGDGLAGRAVLVLAPVCVGVAVYFPLAWLFRVPEMGQVVEMVRRRK